MRRRLCIVVVATVVLIGAAAGAAVGLTGGVGTATAAADFGVTSIIPPSGPPGTTVTVHGVGCPQTTQVNILFETASDPIVQLASGSGQPDASGAWSATFQIPADADPAQGYVLEARCVAPDDVSVQSFKVTTGPVFYIASESPASGPPGTPVEVQTSPCDGAGASVEIDFLQAGGPFWPLESVDAQRLASGLWSATLYAPTGQAFIQARCTMPGVGEVLATVPFVVTGPPPETTTTVPSHPLDGIAPTSGPAETIVSVHASGCDPGAGGFEAFLAADAHPYTDLATAWGGDRGAGGTWTASLTVPAGLDPSKAYSIGGRCWDTGLSGENVAFGYVLQAFTVTAPSTTTTFSTTPTTTTPAPNPVRSGYWMLGADGHVYAFGNAHPFGNASGAAVAMATRRDGKGYWVTDAAGDVNGFGAAHSHGARPSLRVGERVSTISATPSGNGYWLFTNRGRAFAYGDAHSYGDMSNAHLNGPIGASAATTTGHGYYMIGTDGGVFSFGDAQFHGSTGNMHLNQPIVGISPTADNRGYWLVATDGGVFAFDAPFRGSMGSVRLNRPVNGLVAYGHGYLMVASDGGIFDFSDKPFVGSLANNPPASPVVGVAAFTAS
jgi:hypothetical protein